ncbi:hypothetical protein [Halomonas sp. C05BenzN]|uniref:hypothetical protein n=1 Tax=Halomonas sp. C05BenzN TaxID=3411041 RepID=UPI003B941BAA
MSLSRALRAAGLALVFAGSALLVLLPLVGEAEARSRSGSSTASQGSSGIDLATGMVIGAGAAALMSSGRSDAGEATSRPMEHVTESFSGGKHQISGVKRYKRNGWVRDDGYQGADQFRSCPEEGRLRRYQGDVACRFNEGGLFSRSWRHEPTQSVAELMTAEYNVAITVETVQVVEDELYVQFDSHGTSTSSNE